LFFLLANIQSRVLGLESREICKRSPRCALKLPSIIAVSFPVAASPHTISTTLRNKVTISLLVSSQGHLCDKAEKLQEEVMEESKVVLGEGHPFMLTSMNNLAFTFRALGRRQSAVGLMSTCIDKLPDALGVEHPDTRAF
jgi:hypothetical protein